MPARRTLSRRVLGPALLALALGSAACAPAATSQQAPDDKIFPPWQNGENNDAIDRGLEFTIPQVDVLADFHGDITDPKLVLFVGGNYFFAMAPLVKAFEEDHPEYKGRLYWETIPPGLLAKQIKAGGKVTSGNMTWTAKADAYFAGIGRVNNLIEEGLLVGPATPYATNTLTIMVPKGNPANVTGLVDLAKPDLHIAMPNPAWEGIALQIQKALHKAGGDDLVTTVYKTKVDAGTTTLTHVHHRQTPLFLLQGKVQAGVTWQSEAKFQESIGHPISHVDIAPENNVTAVYAGAVVKGAPHPEAARTWLEFIHSPKALEILGRYGFKPYTGDK